MIRRCPPPDGGSGEMRRLSGRRSRRAKPGCTCCAQIQAQSRGAKRKYLAACSSTAPAPAPAKPSTLLLLGWGKKRARSALGTDGRSLPSCPTSNNRCVLNLVDFPTRESRDWANLGYGPAGLIAELALANDVADYLRFRAVCRPWRCSSSSIDPRSQGDGSSSGLDGRFLPRQWIMLDEAHAGTRRCRFLNVSTGECIRMDLPELADNRLLALTPEGLLLLFHERTLSLRLLNPLTRHLTDLPRMTALLDPELHLFRGLGIDVGGSLRVNAVGLVADASTVALSFSTPKVFAIAKPSDERWTIVNKDTYINNLVALPFAGRFYFATGRGIMELNITSNQKPPQLLMAVEQRGLFRFSPMADTLHLVDNAGELMLVHRKLYDAEDDDSGYSIKYEVWRVDLDARILIPVKRLNGRALFMSRCRTISVSAEAFPSVATDTLYYGFGWDEKSNMDGYSLADGSSKPRYSNPQDPWTIVDCLSYCVQGMGEILA